jgi:hypothetical protein
MNQIGEVRRDLALAAIPVRFEVVDGQSEVRRK